MFAMTTKTRYSLLAVLEIARYYGGGLIQVKDIAARHSISPQYLEQLLNRLIHSGFVRAVRGKNGGYELAVPPDRITVLGLLEALEGPLAFSRSLSADDALREVFRNAEAHIRKELDLPLSEILKRQAEMDSQLVFHI
jgi:Rrf2 family protein